MPQFPSVETLPHWEGGYIGGGGKSAQKRLPSNPAPPVSAPKEKLAAFNAPPPRKIWGNPGQLD